MTDLSILCVTKAEPHSVDFLARMADLAVRLGAECIMLVDGNDVHSAGYIESVLDEAVDRCSRDYVLRLDDDEACSAAMERWLENRGYETANHWRFDRVHLFGDAHTALVTPQLFPDHQTRLSVKRFAGSRNRIHAGSPYGGGHTAPCAIEHHKFLVKTVDERRAIVRRYDSISAGAGESFAAFSVPEDVYTSEQIAASLRMWDGESLKARAA